MFEEYKQCMLCPRKCGVNRYKSVGYCGSDANLRLSYYSLHLWEEPVISGENGSGTIFFTNCNLRCIFCQNKKIRDGYGKDISLDRFEEIMLELQSRGANNINLVTPTHYIPHIVFLLQKLKHKELKIPIVYNTSGYENISSLNLLNGLIDIYLTDFKYFDNSLAKKYSCCDDYFEVVCSSIEEMYKQVGSPVIENNLMKSGLIVRILVLPGEVQDSKNIIKYLYSKYGDDIIISIMNQYTPIDKYKYSNLNRKLSNKEYYDVVNFAYDLGVRNCFIQEDETQDSSFIPNFDISIL